MCLNNVNKICFTADHDIVVYKHIICNRNEENQIISYKTSYKFAPVVFKKVLRTKLNMYDDGFGNKRVDEGFHSYIDIEDARRQASRYREVLVQCTITKGSQYYIGKTITMFGSAESYASSKIRYDNVITDYSYICH
jgi:hypothetical protein